MYSVVRSSFFVLSFRASDRRHWRGNPFPFSHADRGLFSFSSERKEEKKRRQKLRFWISLRAFTQHEFRPHLPRERCAMQISSKYCIVSASLFAAAFALKCRAVQAWQEHFLNSGLWPPPTFAALRQRRDLIIAKAPVGFPKGRGRTGRKPSERKIV